MEGVGGSGGEARGEYGEIACGRQGEWERVEGNEGKKRVEG